MILGCRYGTHTSVLNDLSQASGYLLITVLLSRKSGCKYSVFSCLHEEERYGAKSHNHL